MGFWAELFGFGSDAERIRELADEVDRYADRFENAKDHENAALARGFAARIRAAENLKTAKRIYAEFLALLEKEEYDPYRDYAPDRFPPDNNDSLTDNS